ncbi:hypothetical protein BDF14DRAFT_1921279 [Spinellus fusiger]|nr:hypothetical protein BDF14DRAFT_1921279 [Spinellus fusiger]
MKSICNINTVKKALRTVSDLTTRFVRNSLPHTRRQGEALLIVENIRPYLTHCLVCKIDMVKHDWLTYHLTKPSDGQVLIPDFVLYLDNLSSVNFEFFFVEVKRKGNYHNNNLEDDLAKLRKIDVGNS